MARKKEPRPACYKRYKHPLGDCLVRYTNNGSAFDKEFNKKIRKAAPDWFLNSSDEKKQKLLMMAREGEPRPTQQGHPLGAMLGCYTNSDNSCYDAKFNSEIRETAPHWFIDDVTENKKLLLEMARMRKARPTQKTPLGQALSSYTNRRSKMDPEFNKDIREAAPDWFVNSADKHKKQLLRMAHRGEPRPRPAHKLGNVLCNYTRKKNKDYDPEFNEKIREAAPHWFISSVDKNKKKLLEMAREGNSKPHYKTALGSILNSYIYKTNIYDAKFHKEIREVAPHWFINSADENKKQLLEMAQRGEPKPHWDTELGQVLGSYINKSQNYDPEFNKKIREVAPHWFINTADENKKKLLEMAQRGEPRPHCKILKYLWRYTTQNSGAYNADFDKRIRALAPHWFRAKASPQCPGATKRRQERVA